MRQHKVLMLVVALILLMNIFMPVNAEACYYRDLKVTKYVDSDDFHNIEFTIDVMKYDDSNWEHVTGSPIKLKHGESVTFSGLSSDYKYKVVERPLDCFEVDYKVEHGTSNMDVRLVRDDCCTEVKVINKPKKFKLEVMKEVYIDGDLDPRNQEVFNFMIEGITIGGTSVSGITVTASAIDSGEVWLYCGKYTVTEKLKEGFEPKDNPQSVKIPDDKSVLFENMYETPKGWIKVCKDVTNIAGDKTFFNFAMRGEVSTSGAVSEIECVIIPDLPYGTYEFIERVPPGYKGTVTTDSVTINEKNPTGMAMFVNEKCPPPMGSITVCKEVCGEDIDPKLFNFFIKGPVSTESAVSELRCVTIPDLPYGEYYLEEKVPEGYTGSVTTGTVIIGKDNEHPKFTFVNCKECPDMGTITIFKDVHNVDSDETKFQFVMTGYLPPPPILPGTAEIVKANGPAMFYTSEMMPYVFEKMPYGTYFFEEINIPEDYEGVITTGSVTISKEFPKGKVVFENKLKTGTVTICKDVTNVFEDKTMFEYEVRGKDMTTTGLVSEMKCVELELPYGKYDIKEMVPPMYIGITTSGSFEIGPKTPDVKFTFVNEERRGKITVLKDVLNVENDETKFQFNIVDFTDAAIVKGSVEALPPMVSEVEPFVFNGMKFGTYMFEEMVAPGYIGEVTTGSVTISLKNPEGIVEFVNIKECPLGSITIYKDVRNVEEDETKFPFVMTGMSKVEEALTVKNMTEPEPFAVSEVMPYTIEGIAFGTYSFEEMVPEGYIGVNTTGSVTIGPDNRHGELTFVNDKEIVYGNVYVHKEFSEGTDPTYMPFDFRIFSDESATEGSIVAESNVVFESPDGPHKLPVGTYYIGERPYEGWMPLEIQEFMVVEGDNHVTLTNTAIVQPECSLTIEKTVDDSRVKRNEEVTYTVELENDGDLLLFIEFWDSDDEEISEYEEFYLEPGATTTRAFTTSYSSTGTYENVAKATYYMTEGHCDNGPPIDYPNDLETHDEACYIYMEECGMVSDSAIVTVYKDSDPDPKRYRMTITKEADADEYEVGDIITYTITVENTGNQTLTDIEVTDPMLDFEEMIDRLPYSGDDTVEFEVEYLATEEGVIDNTAYAKDDRAKDVEDDETVLVKGEPPVDVPDPGLSIIKNIAGDDLEFEIGDQIWFELIITNTGETVLENIEVRDPFGGYYTEYVTIIERLEPGEAIAYQDVYMVVPENADDFNNVATATVGDLSASDSEWVVIVEREFIDAEEETPLELPAAGNPPMFLFYGLAVLATGIGMTIRKRR